VRTFGDPLGPTPDEQVEEDLALFEIVEVNARRSLSRPGHIRVGIDKGRLRAGLMAKKMRRRLAFRSYCPSRGYFGSYHVNIREETTGVIVKLPFW